MASDVSALPREPDILIEMVLDLCGENGRLRAMLETLRRTLTAIIIGPCSIPPDEWFVHLLGERGRIATASGATMAALSTIATHFNAISEGLSLAPKKHAPLFEKTDDGLALPHPWCMGFLSAMQLRFDDWQPLLDLSRIDHALILPILHRSWKRARTGCSCTRRAVADSTAGRCRHRARGGADVD